MDAIDRVMRAFLEKRPLSAAQTLHVRAEITAFFEELRLGKVEMPKPQGSSRPGGE